MNVRPRNPIPGTNSGVRNTVLEEKEKTQLKSENYAFHCQACLGRHQPDKLTPAYTYLWEPSYRAGHLEAHHVKHLQNQGALGAGNLLVLCEYHHDFLGDQLDQEDLLGRLRVAKKATRMFSKDLEGKEKKKVDGCEIDVPVDVSPFIITIFFTNEHVAAWLDRAENVLANESELEVDE